MFYTFLVVFNIIYFILCLQFFQWKSYFKFRYIKYLFKNKLIIILNLFLIILLIFYFLGVYLIFLTIFYSFLLISIFYLIFKKKKIKFNFTEKLFRLLLINIFFIFLFFLASRHLIIVYTILTPFSVIICDIFDFKKYILDNKFLNTAILKLEQNRPLIIGITGSNGKTSIKEILAKLLSSKYKICTTYKNQNTLKGAIIALNNMPEDTEIFISEMGARQIGDIKSICNLVHPDLAIISSVSGQHLETFKTLDNVYKTKKELPDSIGENLCVFNLDNDLSKKMYLEKQGKKIGISIKTTADIYASNIHISNFKTCFNLHYNNQQYSCTTSLLGEHNVTNILLALAICLSLNINIQSLINAISTLPYTPHRLEYINAHTDILDDTYNCSLDSATMALNVLKAIPKRKIVCTPGIVEGGKSQFEINSKLSKMLNQNADILILVGKTNKIALKSNLKNFKIIEIKSKKITNKINTEKISTIIDYNAKKCAYFVSTLEIAKILFSKILNKDTVLLLLNDLPDEYN